VEHVTEVAVAAGTEYFGPRHAVAPVRDLHHVLLRDRLEEAGPASARVELRARLEERQGAADAAVDAIPLVVEQGAAEGTLGSLPPGDLELFRGELGPPFGV